MRQMRVTFPEAAYDLAKKRAKALDISLAEFVRRAVRQGLAAPSNGQPWMRYAGIVATGIPNSSWTIDEVVYGSNDCSCQYLGS
jgi:hypothetical protein